MSFTEGILWPVCLRRSNDLFGENLFGFWRHFSAMSASLGKQLLPAASPPPASEVSAVDHHAAKNETRWPPGGLQSFGRTIP